jgi:Amylo-alpha-1,6-glucosidase
MAGVSDPPVGPLRHASSVDSRAPILITGLSAAAVMGVSGDLSLIQDTRGADMDWGGVYGEGVRLTGPWWIRIGNRGGSRRSLSETLVQLESSRTGVISHHESGTCRCVQEIVALPELPGVGRRLTFSNLMTDASSVQVEATFSPELAPVLVEGIKPWEYEVERISGGVRIRAFGSALEFATSDPRPAFMLNGRVWDGRPHKGALETVTAMSSLDLPPSQSATMSFIIWGGVEETIRKHSARTSQLLGGAGQWTADAESARREWTDRTPRLRLPAAPEIERGYRLARDALRSLYFAPEPGFVGLVAGYPWYAALWCRDLAWMLPAVLWLGDSPWVVASLHSVFRFQARADLPILGGSAGEMPMQIGPGPVLLYGTSDTTLYYPDLLRRYLDHTGDESIVREFAKGLLLTEKWARKKTNPSTGLLRNGDEGAGLQAAAEAHGRVHYGFDAYDATIWDSTDRRSYAVDIQVLRARALAALGELAPALGLGDEGPQWQAEAQRLREKIASAYWWPAENYLYDSLADDGSPIQKVRPNALLAIADGVLSRDRAVAALNRTTQDDLHTDWGYRTLSSSHPTYNPISYHDGQVWPIASAWAVGAGFTIGQTARAVEGLRRWTSRLDQEAGTLHECYRGDRAEPFNSCFLLGFSVAPFLTQLFEGLWGLHPRGSERSLGVEPHFPVDWSQASLTGISLFGGEVDLRWERPRMTVSWRGKGPLRVKGGETVLEIVSGTSGVLQYGDAREPA